MPDVHVGRAPEDAGPSWPGRELQSSLVGPHRLVQASLRHPHVGQAERPPDHVGQVPGLLQAGNGRGVGPMRRVEVAVGPVGEAQERGAAPRPRWSSSPTSSSAGRAWVDRARRRPRASGPARPGGWRSTPADCGTPPRPRRPSPLGRVPAGRATRPSARATARRRAGAPRPPRPRRGPAAHRHSASLSTGRHAERLVGERLEPAARWPPPDGHGPSPGSRARPGPPPRSKSPPAIAWRIASSAFAFLRVPLGCPPMQLRDERRAARRAGAPAARRRTGGGSDTTGAGRRAGRGTGSVDRAPPASPCRHPGR